LGVSADKMQSHLKFAQKHCLPFPLISDTEKDIIHLYDVWGPKIVYEREMIGIIRTTFIIDETGVIMKVISNVDTKGHARQILG
jgi:peroxiredoxin Q/BCP